MYIQQKPQAQLLLGIVAGPLLYMEFCMNVRLLRLVGIYWQFCLVKADPVFSGNNMAHNGAFAWNHWRVLTPTIWGNLNKICLVMMNLNANGNLTGERNYIRDLAKLTQIEGKTPNLRILVHRFMKI